MSTPDSGMQWYVARDGRQHGPISDMEMRKLVELGHLRPADLIWRAGFADWRPAHAVFSPAPSAPSPSAIPAADARPRPQSIMPRFEATVGRGAPVGATARPEAAVEPQVRTSTPNFATQPIFQPMQQAQAPQAQAPQNQPQQNQSPQFVPSQTTQRPSPAPSGPMVPFQIAPQQLQPQPQQQFQPGMSSGFEPRFEAAPKPSPNYQDADFDEETSRKSGVRRFAIAASVLLLIGGGGYFVKTTETGKALVTGLKNKTIAFAKTTIGGDKPAGEKSESAATAPATNEPVTAVAAAGAVVGSMPDSAKALEAKLQKFVHWQLIATEFPDWYRERVASGAKLMAENKPEAEVSQYLAKSLVELRRSNAEAALAASPETLKKMAGNFQGLVTRMGQEGAPTCMTFISSGEANPTVVDLANDPAKNAEINAHFAAIFTAISEGRKTPVQHAAPADGDYKLLVAQLVKIGWTQAELELFADPKGSTRTTPERYCKMMQDFFEAHLTIPDAAVQERLLHRTLKLVVAG